MAKCEECGCFLITERDSKGNLIKFKCPKCGFSGEFKNADKKKKKAL